MITLREQYHLLRNFFKTDFRTSVYWCVWGMIAAIAVGFLAGLWFPEVIDAALESFTDMVEDSGIINEDGSISVFALLANNWWAMLLSAAYGFIPFIFLPVTSLISNSLILGVFAALYLSNGLSLLMYFAGILPHGIFELPALVLSIACGVYLCRNMNRIVIGNPNRIPMVQLLCDLLRVMLLLVAPMTAAAALIEVYITPLVIALFI